MSAHAPSLAVAVLVLLLSPSPAAATAAADGGTILVLAATYGANCNASSGDLTPAVGAFCDGAANCSFALCICHYDKVCPGSTPCVPDPAPACAKDFRVSWRCTGDGPGVANRTAFLPAEADLSAAGLTCAAPPPPVYTPRDITVAAFVYDPWTPEPAVFSQHGPDWTEWELVRRAEPRFPGHIQPKVPVWGELNTALPATWDLLNGAALAAGIEVYLWDFYWWGDAPTNPLLVRGLEEGFLSAPSSANMRFAVMWANQGEAPPRTSPPLSALHGVPCEPRTCLS